MPHPLLRLSSTVSAAGVLACLLGTGTCLSQALPIEAPSLPPAGDDTQKLGPAVPDHIPGVVSMPPLPKPTRSPLELPEGVSVLMQGLPPENASPPSADPHNLEGAYIHREDLTPLVQKTMYGNRVPYTQAGFDTLSKRILADNDGRPETNSSARCLPPGPTWQTDLNFPFSIFQTAHEIYFLFEEYHGVWTIRMDANHLDNAPAEYMGDSIGHWEGDTLVVETRNYKADMWLDIFGTPLSKTATQTFRIRKIDDGKALEIITTINDPVNYRQPWSFARAFQWRPDKVITGEYNCEIQVGKADGVSRYGVNQ